MIRTAFFVTSPSHHLDDVSEVRGHLEGSSRVFSFFRVRDRRRSGKEPVYELTPQVLRLLRRVAGSVVRRTAPSTAKPLTWGRPAAWQLLRRSVSSALDTYRPHVAVVPNDSAFPLLQVIALLRERGIPWLLLQEGIRFDDVCDLAYGSQGANVIAAWGRSSRDFFESRAADCTSIRVTGSPRFDGLFRLADTREPCPQEGPKVAVLTNPVDQLGLCSKEAKLASVAWLLSGLTCRGDSVTLRVHPGEQATEYLGGMRDSSRIDVSETEGLWELLRRHSLVVVVGSTVGLEALALGCRLAVLRIPSCEPFFDYVQSEVADLIDQAADVDISARALLSDRTDRSRATREYLARSLANPGAAGREVATILHEIGSSVVSSRPRVG